MQLILDTNGLVLKKRNNAFWIVAKAGRRMISPHRISSIAVMADCLISAAAIRLAAQHRIPIYFLDGAGRAQARLWSPQFGSIASIRRAQARYAETPVATEWVIGQFELKLQGQVACLQQLRRRKRGTQAAQQLGQALSRLQARAQDFEPYRGQPLSTCRAQLMGVEGQLARNYWQALGSGLPAPFAFERRSRRPAQDPFNAALNYLYGMLYNTVSQAVMAAGLDTHLGLLHSDQYAKPTFVFDFIEPYRPWVDRLLTQAILDRQVDRKSFDPADPALTQLSKAGIKKLITLFNGYFQGNQRYQGRVLSRRDHIYRQATAFAQQLLHPLPPLSDDHDPLDLL